MSDLNRSSTPPTFDMLMREQLATIGGELSPAGTVGDKPSSAAIDRNRVAVPADDPMYLYVGLARQLLADFEVRIDKAFERVRGAGTAAVADANEAGVAAAARVQMATEAAAESLRATMTAEMADWRALVANDIDAMVDRVVAALEAVREERVAGHLGRSGTGSAIAALSRRDQAVARSDAIGRSLTAWRSWPTIVRGLVVVVALLSLSLVLIMWHRTR